MTCVLYYVLPHSIVSVHSMCYCNSVVSHTWGLWKWLNILLSSFTIW